MKLKNVVAILMIGLFTFHSCKKEAIKTTETPAENMVVNDSLNALPPEAKPADTTAETQIFSALKNKEISLQKDAITLNSLKEDSDEKAYLHFNDDQSKAEIYMPGESKGIIFDRKGSEGDYTWTDGKNELIQWKGYVLRTLKQGTPLFGGDVM